MKNKSNAFTLIEVLIATGILSIAVFGVYKLIGENTKIINNSNNYLQVNYLFPAIHECIDNLNLDNTNLVGTNISLGEDGGNCDTSNTTTIINNIEYNISGEVSSSGVTYTQWNIEIESSESKTLTGTYRELK